MKISFQLPALAIAVTSAMGLGAVQAQEIILNLFKII